jgi:hypothetical protein
MVLRWFGIFLQHAMVMGKWMGVGALLKREVRKEKIKP